MRLFTGSLATETNTFAPLPAGLDAYRADAYYPAGTHPDRPLMFSGPLWAARQRAREHGWTLIEGLVASAMPAGVTTRHAYETLRDELLEDLRAALPIDVAVFGMHGAMVADGYDDCEGDLLGRIREIVGPSTVVGIEVDPHTHLSEAMVANANLIVAFKEYPHTDIAERAFELVDLCAAAARGVVRPVPGVFDCDMIAVLHTSRDPMRGFVDRVKALEGHDGVLSVSPIHGFPWGDTPDMGTKVLVYADGDRGMAQTLARQLGEELIGLRDRLKVDALDIDAALDRAISLPGPTVLADGADNSGGGAPNDSTFILRRMRERGIGQAALGPLWDPVAVSIAFNAGEGAELALRIGGKIGPSSGDPLDARVRVMALRRAHTMSGLAGRVSLGDCALVDVGGIDVLLSSVRVQAMGTDMFTGMGCDLSTKSIVVVKSSQHFQASYAKVARQILYVQAPGTLTMDLASLPFRKVRRPKWGM
jgi:microcystin degradation protein MlrC